MSACFMVFHMKFTKSAQYHDAAKNTRYLIFSWYFEWNLPLQLSTMMLQITRIISFFHGISPWNSQKQLSTAMLQITRVISFFRGISHEIHQISSVPWCRKEHALSNFFMIFPMKFATAAQYHDATNNTRYLIFSCYFIFHGISYDFHQNSSGTRSALYTPHSTLDTPRFELPT